MKSLHVVAGVLAVGFAVAGLAQEPGEEGQPAASEATPQASEPAEPAPDAAAPAEPATIPVAVEPEAEAPASDAYELETIQVTASKRIKSQRDLPASVGAIGGEALEQMRAQGMRDYLKLVPGVSFADQGDDSSVPIIRGIASQTNFGFTAQTTGLYLDDMPFADLSGPQSYPDLSPFDLERVEVLKGPQSTLFGSGALAGAVRYITQKPVHGLWQAKAYHMGSTAEDGGGQSDVTAGAVNVPLFSDAALRFVGLTRQDPGWYDMSATDPGGNSLRDEPDADARQQAAWRGLASWDPTDELKLSAFYFGQYTDSDDVSYPMDYAPFPSPSAYRFGGGNLLATYDLGWANLLSSTNSMTKHTYTRFHQEFLLDQHQQNSEEFYNQLIGDVRGWTQELRLISPEGGDASDWDWLLGAAVMQYDSFIFQYSNNPGPPTARPRKPSDVDQAGRINSFLFATIGSDATEEALFGEATRRLGEHWEVGLGLRKYRTKLDADTVVSGAQIVALTQQPESREHFEPKSSGVNPKASIRYVHNRHLQWYALAAKGFQFGGVQLNPPIPAFVTSAEQAGFHFAPYKSSELWNYESGIRTEWLDRRLRFDVGLFYLDWSDLQLTIAVPLAQTDATFGLIANVGRAHSAGIETALEVIPFAGARVTSSAAWIDAVTDVPFDESNSDGAVPPGTRLPGTPRFMWANVFSYDYTLPFHGSWTINPVVTHSHIGESPDAIRPTGTIGGYDTLDARLALIKSDSRYQPEVSFGINNLTDVRGVTYHSQAMAATGSGNVFHQTHFVPPRTAMLSLSFKY